MLPSAPNIYISAAAHADVHQHMHKNRKRGIPEVLSFLGEGLLQPLTIKITFKPLLLLFFSPCSLSLKLEKGHKYTESVCVCVCVRFLHHMVWVSAG